MRASLLPIVVIPLLLVACSKGVPTRDSEFLRSHLLEYRNEEISEVEQAANLLKGQQVRLEGYVGTVQLAGDYEAGGWSAPHHFTLEPKDIFDSSSVHILYNNSNATAIRKDDCVVVYGTVRGAVNMKVPIGTVEGPLLTADYMQSCETDEFFWYGYCSVVEAVTGGTIEACKARE